MDIVALRSDRSVHDKDLKRNTHLLVESGEAFLLLAVGLDLNAVHDIAVEPLQLGEVPAGRNFCEVGVGIRGSERRSKSTAGPAASTAGIQMKRKLRMQLRCSPEITKSLALSPAWGGSCTMSVLQTMSSQ
jgi:hypothetical protein